MYTQYFSFISFRLPEYPSGSNSFDFQPILYSQYMMVQCLFLAILAQTSVCMDEHMGENTLEAFGYWEKCLRDFPFPKCFLLSQCILPWRTVCNWHMHLSHLQCYTVTDTHTHTHTYTLFSIRRCAHMHVYTHGHTYRPHDKLAFWLVAHGHMSRSKMCESTRAYVSRFS